MADQNITNIDLEAAFAKDCKVINLKYEYPGYMGNENYLLLSNLNERELTEKYGNKLDEFKPYILGDAALKEAFTEIHRKEDRERKRLYKKINTFGIDEMSEKLYAELTVPDFTATSDSADDHKAKIQEIQCAWTKLSEMQKRRLKSYYLEKKTYQEIAHEEDCCYSSVRESIEAGKKKFEKLLKNTRYFGPLFSKHSEGDNASDGASSKMKK